jgi:hypothetical protein
MLSKAKYSLLCLLGIEVFYALCIAYGSLLSGKAQELHHSLFELLPGFAWSNLVSYVWGAVLLGIFGIVAGWYVAWMHNTSLIDTRG